MDANASVTSAAVYSGWWRIGWDNGWLANPTASFAGLIDEVQIWDRVRSAGEITNSFDQPLVGNEPGLVSYWRLDEYVCGNSAADATGSGNTGAFVGSGPTWEFTGFPVRKATGYPFYKVDSLALVGTNLYAGGVFAGMGGVARNNLARVNPTGTGNVDSSFNPGPVGRSDYDGSIQSSVVRALLLNGRDLYVGGGFTTIAGAERSGFAFLPVADAPVLIQDTTTNLFITRNPGDGLEVTHFRITGITGGSLFKSDGVTAVSVGDFITVAEGAAGLKLVPGGSLTVVSALNATSAGAGTGIASLTMVASPPPVLAFSPPTYSIREGQGNVVITVRKYGDGATSVNYATSNLTATAGADYQGRTGTFSFSAADKLKNIIILIGDDFVAEGEEQFAVNLSNETNAPVVGPRAAIVTIADNDGAGSQTVAAQMPTNAPPSAGGVLVVSLQPPQANGQWRLVGELNWHNDGGSVSGLVTGNYGIEFRPVNGYFPPFATPITESISAGTTNLFTYYYAATPQPETGNLSVRIVPGDVAGAVDMNSRGQWRRQGTTNWLNHGDMVPNLSAGSYVVEFKPVTNRSTPLPQLIQVGGDNAIYSGVGTYFRVSPLTATTPTVVSFDNATTNARYLYNGQLQTSAGFGSGFVVKKRVVLTAAHVLFDDVLLSYSTYARWFFQRYRDQLEPVAQVPRGWYVFDGYAAQRQQDNSPGLSTPASQNLDAAALYFLEDAGRGGYGGYLASDADDNEYLLGANNKFLAGYPLDGVPPADQGKLFATAPANLTFTHLYTSIFATTDIQSFPGNSGGPLYVQAGVDTYLPAALLLGGAGETLVRAINSEVVDLINRAETSGNGGGNIVGGGVTLLSPGLSAPPFGTGLLTVNLTPLNVAGARSGWRIKGITDTNYFTDSLTTVGLIGGQSCPIEFKSVPGFITPSERTVQITVGQVVTIQANYVPTSRPSLNLNRATGLNLTGVIGAQYRVEFASSLVPPVVWSPLLTLTLTNSPATIANTLPASTGSRFYRAVLVP